MNIRRWLIAIALPVVLVAHGAHAQTVKRQDYLAGFAGDTDTNLCAADAGNPSGLNIGAVCFTPTNARVTFTIEDATGLTVAGYWVFLSSGGGVVAGPGAFCGTSPSVLVPKSATRIMLYIGGPVLGPMDCLLEGPQDSAGIGTNGTVVATFRA